MKATKVIYPVNGRTPGVTPLGPIALVSRSLRPNTGIVCEGRRWNPWLGAIFRRVR